MDYYKNEILNVLDEIVSEGYETRAEVLKRWRSGDTQDDFGNLTGSRFCNRYKAEEALKEAGFPFNEELNDLLTDVGYDFSILDKGAEAVDVILCELVAMQYVDDIIEKDIQDALEAEAES